MRALTAVPTALAFTLAALLPLAFPAPPGPPGAGADRAGTGPQPVERLRVTVLETLPHDPDAFTQGLELAGDQLYEGTGLVGESAVRRGPPGRPPTVVRPLDPPLFGEGITLVGPALWQLTWQNGIALERDADTLEERRRVRYDGEGWGLCHRPDAGRLVMSDGTARLTLRDPVSFAVTGTVTVTADGRPVDGLNELECVGDTVYANVRPTDRILRIDAATGAVTAEIDASGLLADRERDRADELNGIAALPGGRELLLTGKRWPTLFRVALTPR
ncbi:glutaminyl-peptide cyclotransferase [Kitasatospora sp. NPDC054939]